MKQAHAHPSAATNNKGTKSEEHTNAATHHKEDSPKSDL
jgi:hypothetical protein